MLESIVFHSQLSSIMEKLVISAVTEINKLMTDYCSVLRMELSREKHDNDVLRDKLRVAQINAHQGSALVSDPRHPNAPLKEPRNATKIGNNGVRLQSDSKQRGSDWSNGAAAATQTGATEEQDEETDCKIESVTIKRERRHEETVPAGETEMKAPEQSSTSPLVSQQQHPAEQSTSFQAEWQFHSLPPEGSQELDEDTTQHQLNISSGLDQLDDVGFSIKREPDSPNLNPSILDEAVSTEQGFELHQGMVSQMYPDYGALSLDSTFFDIPGPGPCTFSLPLKTQHTSTTMDSQDLSLPRQRISDCDISGHHGNQTGSGGNSSSSSSSRTSFRDTRASDYMKYICQNCGKGFPFLSTLKRHQLTHTGERTQHCGQCGKSFIRRSHLRRHELVHTGLRPFACQFCGRRFSRSSHLNVHMKIHWK